MDGTLVDNMRFHAESWLEMVRRLSARVPDLSDKARATLASLCLGAWEPGFDEHARRNAIAGFVVRWYAAGRT